MTRDVVFRPEAEQELLEARGWYDSRRAGLGDEFSADVEALVAIIREHPRRFPVVRGATRRAVLRRFPYALYFRVTVASVVVLAVHGRQDPWRWQGRQ